MRTMRAVIFRKYRFCDATLLHYYDGMLMILLIDMQHAAMLATVEVMIAMMPRCFGQDSGLECIYART